LVRVLSLRASRLIGTASALDVCRRAFECRVVGQHFRMAPSGGKSTGIFVDVQSPQSLIFFRPQGDKGTVSHG